MKKKFSVDLTTQNKLIITALLISTALIVAISFWAVNRIKIELDESYRSFGELLTKTLAVQNYDIVKKQENEVKDDHNLLNSLTQREEEVLDLLTQGLTYKNVAKTLFISDTTVKTHVNNIFQKLQVNDRTGAVLYAINNGFMSKKRTQIAV